MKLYIDNLFPTTVFQAKEVLNPENLNNIKNDIDSKFNENLESLSYNWQSLSSVNLHEEQLYSKLCENILTLSKKYLDDKFFEYENIIITSMWANVLKPGESHRPHTHANNYLSGVFYVNDNNTTNICFTDPRPQAYVIQLHSNNYNYSNAPIYMYPTTANSLLLFPSWLSHYVPTNTSTENRISISFNLMLKGRVDRLENLQSNTF